jgi:hypothetical protein
MPLRTKSLCLSLSSILDRCDLAKLSNVNNANNRMGQAFFLSFCRLSAGNWILIQRGSVRDKHIFIFADGKSMTTDDRGGGISCETA